MPPPGERGGLRAGVALALMAKAFIIFNKTSTSTYQKKKNADEPGAAVEVAQECGSLICSGRTNFY